MSKIFEELIQNAAQRNENIRDMDNKMRRTNIVKMRPRKENMDNVKKAIYYITRESVLELVKNTSSESENKDISSE